MRSARNVQHKRTQNVHFDLQSEGDSLTFLDTYRVMGVGECDTQRTL